MTLYFYSEERDLELENQLIDRTIDNLKRGDPAAKQDLNELNKYSLHPIPSAFKDIPLFDERYGLGSDREHNLPSNENFLS